MHRADDDALYVPDHEALSLRVELDRWWNDMGIDPDDNVSCTGSHVPHTVEESNTFLLDEQLDGNPYLQPYSILLTCLYNQQTINLARPMLSLSPTSVQHALALQSCINAVRKICSTILRAMQQNVDALYWPGYVDMVFFGSLILVYGSRKEGNRPGSFKL
jgi:hypothetical protein